MVRWPHFLHVISLLILLYYTTERIILNLIHCLSCCWCQCCCFSWACIAPVVNLMALLWPSTSIIIDVTKCGVLVNLYCLCPRLPSQPVWRLLPSLSLSTWPPSAMFGLVVGTSAGRRLHFLNYALHLCLIYMLFEIKNTIESVALLWH